MQGHEQTTMQHVQAGGIYNILLNNNVLSSLHTFPPPKTSKRQLCNYSSADSHIRHHGCFGKPFGYRVGENASSIHYTLGQKNIHYQRVISKQCLRICWRRAQFLLVGM